jgi:hypothetical protein
MVLPASHAGGVFSGQLWGQVSTCHTKYFIYNQYPAHRIGFRPWRPFPHKFQRHRPALRSYRADLSSPLSKAAVSDPRAAPLRRMARV